MGNKHLKGCSISFVIYKRKPQWDIIPHALEWLWEMKINTKCS